MEKYDKPRIFCAFCSIFAFKGTLKYKFTIRNFKTNSKKKRKLELINPEEIPNEFKYSHCCELHTFNSHQTFEIFYFTIEQE